MEEEEEERVYYGNALGGCLAFSREVDHQGITVVSPAVRRKKWSISKNISGNMDVGL